MRATPVRHVVPAMGVRVDAVKSGKSFVYSSDTEPSANLAALARGAGLLIHEATGKGAGHSSAAQAAAVAREAQAGKLLLIHTDPYADHKALLRQARAVFSGKVELASDRMRVAW